MLKKMYKEYRLKDITTKIGSGATPKGGHESYQEEGIPLIRSLNVYDDGFRTSGLAYLDDQQAKKLSNVTVQENDVLLNITGASVARCCIVPSDLVPARVNQHVSIIRVKPELVDSKFLSILLTSKKYKDLLLHHGESGSTRQAITKLQLEEFVVSLPPLPEQTRIVAILDEAFANVSQAVVNAEKNLANARELFDSYLNEVFTHKGEGWEERSFTDICDITSKLVDPRKPENVNFPHIGAGNIVSNTGALIDVKTALEEELISGKFLFDDTMILYSKIRPYLKKVCRPEFSGLCSADVYPLKPNKELLDKNFLFHMLLSDKFTKFAIMGSDRAGMPKVNRNHLFSYRCFLPNIKEQKYFADCIDELAQKTQELEDVYRRKLAALAELKQALLQKAFTGEL